MVVRARARLTGRKALLKKYRRIASQLPGIVADKDGVIADIVVRHIQERFETKQGPDGTPWPALAEGNFPRGNPDKKDILRDSGKLSKSIGVASSGFVSSIRGNTGFGFRVGVLGNLPYARTMQSGGASPLTGGKVPARPFMGVSDEMVEDAISHVQERVAKVIR